jgi:hypothetical protein
VRRGLQLAVLAALTGPGVVLLGPMTAAQAAGTQSATPGVLQSAWFWQTAAEQANPPVAPPAPPPTEPSGVPKGDLGVAHTSTDNTSSKLAVVAFQVGALKAGATVNSFKLSLTLDSSGTNVGPSPAPLVACLPTRLWPAGEGSDITNAPPTDCSSKATPKVSGSTYTFDISDIAQQWVGSDNLGVALINDPANTQTPFQAVFSVKSIKATMTYTPPVAAAPPPPASTPGLGGSGLGNGTGTSAGASGAGTTAPPPSGPVNLPPSGPTTQTTTPSGQTPQVAPSTTTPATTPAALAKPDSSRPNGAFWLGALAIALLVVVGAVVLADDAVPTPTATTTRLGRVLRERERARQLEALDSANADATTTTLALRRV